MEDPTDRVIEGLGRGEGLVAALVGDDPQSSGEEAGEEAVESPEGEGGGKREVGMWDVLGSNERLKVLGAFPKSADDKEVVHARRRMVESSAITGAK